MRFFTRPIKFFSYARHLKLFYQELHRKHLNIYCPIHRPLTHRSYTKHSTRSTIFALSTPPGVSAIAVIRISGPHASNVLYQMGKLQMVPQPRKAILCKICDPNSEELLDKALVLWFPSPNSFTGEDICELHVHGGIAVVKSILKALSKMTNFRLAEPGEFTKRAFMANKLDLTEIEGLADLLHAETEIQQKQALQQMDGVLNKLYTDWSDRIKKCLANIEAYIDFSEDQHLDNSVFDLVQQDLHKLQLELSNHLSDNRRGERLRTGVFTVLIGQPNVGKSSLLNSLCQRDIAIVSPTAGTTRDVIEASFNLGGYLVNISDTAGIRETEDLIELEGVKRAKDRSSKADLIIFILEARRVLKIIESNSLSHEELVRHLLETELGDKFIKDLCHFEKSFNENSQATHVNNNIIILFNKIDLLNEDERRKVSHLEDQYPYICSISCTEGTGLTPFLSLFMNIVEEMCSTQCGENPTLIQERHRWFVQNCLQSISEFNEWVNVDVAIAAEKLRVAMNELGKITGKVLVEHILDVIFRDFCIGK